jgi:hypothetical protein
METTALFRAVRHRSEVPVTVSPSAQGLKSEPEPVIPDLRRLWLRGSWSVTCVFLERALPV